MNSTYANWVILDDMLERAKWAARTHSKVTEDDFRAAESNLTPLIQALAGPIDIAPLEKVFFLRNIAELSLRWLLWMSTCSLIAALLWRGGLLLGGVGLAVVKNNGAPASRLRVFIRSLVAWSPFLLVFLLWQNIFWPAFDALQGGVLMVLAGVIVAAAYLAIAILSALLPGRGIPDRLAGTWLVPR